MQSIRFWCPEAQQNVYCNCTIKEFGDLTLKIAIPKTCANLLTKGCTFSQEKNCLLDKEIQGKYKLENEAKL